MFNWLTGKSSHNAVPTERKQIQLTPLDSFSVPFIEIKDWSDGVDYNLSSYISLITRAQQQFQKAFSLHSKLEIKALSMPPSLKTSEEKKTGILTSIYNHKHQKLYNFQSDLYNKAISLCNEMISFIDNVQKNSYPVHINANGFKTDLEKRTYKNEKLEKLQQQLNYLKPKIIIPQAKKNVTEQEVIQSLNLILGLFDEYQQFMPFSDFDYTLSDFLEHNFSEEIQKILSIFDAFEYEKGLAEMDSLMRNVSTRLGLKINSSPSVLGVFYSGTRIIFDKSIILIPYLLNNNLSTKQFLINCEKVRSLTPEQLNAPKNIFLPEHYKVPVSDLFTKFEGLKKAIDELKYIQFLSSPLDISYYAANAIVHVNRVINCVVFNKGNENIELPDEAKANVLAFDELFTYIYMAVSIDPPANAVAISVLLKSFSSIEICTQLTYASTSLQASISYLCDFHKAKNV